MLRRALLSAVLVAGLLVGVPGIAHAAGGVFSVHCSTLSRISNDDPIVFPGQPGAAHQHQFTGNTTTDAYSTYDSMLAASTTCKLGEDTAGYWTPTLIDAAGNVIGVRAWLVYYRGGSTTVPFPADMRIVAGYKTPGFVVGSKGFGFSCGSSGTFYASPNIDCSAGYLKFTVTFPAFWDGVLTHTDDTTHVAVKKSTTFNIPLPKVSMILTFDVHNGSGLMLSSDMGAAPGSTLHADFWNTWQQPALDQLVKDCLNTGQSCLDLTSVV